MGIQWKIVYPKNSLQSSTKKVEETFLAIECFTPWGTSEIKELFMKLYNSGSQYAQPIYRHLYYLPIDQKWCPELQIKIAMNFAVLQINL